MGRKEDSESKKKIDVEILQQALKIMKENDLVEFIYEQKDLKIGLKKATQAQLIQPNFINQTPSVAQPVAPETKPEKPKVDENLYIVKSPMVGTFYRAPSPDSPPFVNIGDVVDQGKTLCIIEAMKIMNEIKSEVKGVIKEILVENAQAVEFNQPMFIIEKK